MVLLQFFFAKKGNSIYLLNPRTKTAVKKKGKNYS